MMKANLPNSAIKVAAMNDNVVLTGRVASAHGSHPRRRSGRQLRRRSQKGRQHAVGVADGEQVMLKVRISEMQRQIAKQFGINLSGVRIINGTPLALSTSNPYGLLGSAMSDLSGGQLGQVCGTIPPARAAATGTAVSTIPACESASVFTSGGNLLHSTTMSKAR